MSFQGSRINPRKFHRSQVKFYVVLIPLSVFMILPIVFIVNNAFKPLDELFLFPPTFFVHQPTLNNFRELFQNSSSSGIPMSRYLFNSIVITLAVMLFSIIITALAGYAFSKMKFKLKKALFEINTLALMFVPIAVMIPRFFTIAKLGILNTYWAEILPLVAMPVGLFLLKQFMDQVPDELLEAAYIDGAKEIQIFTRIIVPIIKPALATVAILAFQAAWNDIEASNLYVNNESLRTLAFYMSTLTANVGSQGVNVVAGQGMAAAASLMMFVPNVIMFILLQSRVMNTMAHSGLK